MKKKWKILLRNLRFSLHEHRWFVRLIGILMLVIFLLIIGSATLELLLERKGEGGQVIHNFMDAVWWSVVTIATVGFGDKVPITVGGRLVGIALILLGLTTLPVYTGLIASIFVEDRLKGAKGLKTITDNHHIVICGWNDAAENMLHAFTERLTKDVSIVLIGNYTVEFFESLQGKYPELSLKFVRGEATQEEVLRRANIQGADQVLILTEGNLTDQSADDRVVIVANAVHYLAGPQTRVTVQLLNGTNKNLLRRIGIEDILIYDEMGGYLLANNAVERNTLNLYDKLFKEHKNQLVTTVIPSMFIGRTYIELFEYMYHHEGHLAIGIFTETPKLGLSDIFSDDESAIDNFIRSALEQSQSVTNDRKNNIRIHPPKDYVIQKHDRVLIIC